MSTLFPYTTLFRSPHDVIGGGLAVPVRVQDVVRGGAATPRYRIGTRRDQQGEPRRRDGGEKRGATCCAHVRTSCAAVCLDRKSTRLNSSHGYISYAGRCLHSFPTRRSSDLHTMS